MEIGTLVIGAILGGVPSWFISKHFAESTSKDLDNKLHRHVSNLNKGASFNSFEKMLRVAKWKKEMVNHNEVWICEENNTFQITICGDNRSFKETWTVKFPNQNTSLFHVNLKINNTIIKSLPFISADGGRYTLPLPELSIIDDEPSFYWLTNSLEVKISEIINNFYRYDSLKEVSKITGVQLITLNQHIQKL